MHQVGPVRGQGNVGYPEGRYQQDHLAGGQAQLDGVPQGADNDQDSRHAQREGRQAAAQRNIHRTLQAVAVGGIDRGQAFWCQNQHRNNQAGKLFREIPVFQTLIDDGRLFAQSKGPQHFVPDEDRVMLCGSMAMIKDHAADLERRGFEEGANNKPGQFVIERAFVG